MKSETKGKKLGKRHQRPFLTAPAVSNHLFFV
jgi:hypothetical protein